MVNSYSMTPATYGYSAVTNVPTNKPNTKKSSSVPYTFGGLTIGAGAGALIGWKKNPFIAKNGEVINNFAEKAFNIFINKKDDSAKKIYNDSVNILEGLKKVKTPEDLKTLLNNNKDFTKDMCTGFKQTPDKYIKTITKDNLQANIDTISAQIKATNTNKLQSIKNQIQACWDKSTKTFKKNNNVSQDVFNAINEATQKSKNKLIGKYALIGGLGTALVTFLTYNVIKILKNKKQSQQIAQKNVHAQPVNIQ